MALFNNLQRDLFTFLLWPCNITKWVRVQVIRSSFLTTHPLLVILSVSIFECTPFVTVLFSPLPIFACHFNEVVCLAYWLPANASESFPGPPGKHPSTPYVVLSPAGGTYLIRSSLRPLCSDFGKRNKDDYLMQVTTYFLLNTIDIIFLNYFTNHQR